MARHTKPAADVRPGDVLAFGMMPFYVFETQTLAANRTVLRGTYTDIGYWDCVNGVADPTATSILDDESMVVVTGRMPGAAS